MHLKEVPREFQICEFIEGPTIQGFDLGGTFMAHLNLVGYTNLSEIFTPQEVERDRGLETVISTDVDKLKHGKPKTKQRPEGEYPSQDASQIK